MTYPLTVSMTPSFWCEGDWLLRAQLRCLSEQVMKDFDVLIVDAHYSRRVHYMSELAERYKLNIVHVPYVPATHVAKRMDCAVFNAAYCFSESPRIVRLSCWRFVRPEFTQACMSDHAVDFFFHNCEPPTEDRKHPVTWHDKGIWNYGSDEVHWDKIPATGRPGCRWSSHSDKDEPAKLFPRNCFGNYMVPRAQWLAVNGCDETFTNTVHYEDIDFCVRARSAGLKCERRSHLLYRMHHSYGSFDGRSTVTPDVTFKRNCAQCEAACQVLEPNRFDLKRRIAAGELTVLEDLKVWVCNTCHLCGPVYHADSSEHVNDIERRGVIKSNIIPQFKLGRNLSILTADMDGKPLTDKISIYARSWTDPRYYTK